MAEGLSLPHVSLPHVSRFSAVFAFRALNISLRISSNETLSSPSQTSVYGSDLGRGRRLALPDALRGNRAGRSSGPGLALSLSRLPRREGFPRSESGAFETHVPWGNCIAQRAAGVTQRGLPAPRREAQLPRDTFVPKASLWERADRPYSNLSLSLNANSNPFNIPLSCKSFK